MSARKLAKRCASSGAAVVSEAIAKVAAIADLAKVDVVRPKAVVLKVADRKAVDPKRAAVVQVVLVQRGVVLKDEVVVPRDATQKHAVQKADVVLVVPAAHRHSHRSQKRCSRSSIRTTTTNSAKKNSKR